MSVDEGSAEESVRERGSKLSSVYKSSEEYFEYICDPCKDVGDHTEAQGFCTECEEYLCCTCFRSHSRSKMSKHHTLLDKNVMPKKLVNKVNMSGESDSAVTSAVAKMNVSKINADVLKCNEEYTYIRDIGIKADTDEKNCFISGMTLVSNSELVLCDYNNNFLKLVNTENGIIKDVLVLQANLGGITTISKDQVAVVLDKKCQIQFISVSRRLSIVRTIKTNGICVDVKHFNGKLYVSFLAPARFQILQLTGAVIKTIKPSSEVLEHCTVPRHIAISPDESLIYVSDWKTNKVFSMNLSGNMVSLYQGELEYPFDIIISPFGSVYLCNREQHILYKMTPDLSEATVLLAPVDGLEAPQAMCLNTVKQHLYISSGSAKYSNFLKVYKLK